ncbi:hypothetical protein BDN70DRAFT_935184 [Pholiota conissans]|uniref:Uncharacterized protein n=1 Tax=Pholiota conissans TaxID=109636 RepID=A0A9P5YYE1_9AGAR|nr:hypothetical protein BDN70DRAFT_935184 [Pholiota conissans]
MVALHDALKRQARRIEDFSDTIISHSPATVNDAPVFVLQSFLFLHPSVVLSPAILCHSSQPPVLPFFRPPYPVLHPPIPHPHISQPQPQPHRLPPILPSFHPPSSTIPPNPHHLGSRPWFASFPRVLVSARPCVLRILASSSPRPPPPSPPSYTSRARGRGPREATGLVRRIASSFLCIALL